MFVRNAKLAILISRAKSTVYVHAFSYLMESLCSRDEIEFQVLNKKIKWQVIK